MVLSKINWLFLVWFFFLSAASVPPEVWANLSVLNPLTGKEMALHHLWCQTKPDSEISREFWTHRQNIKTITFLKSLHICFWLLYLIHQAFAAQIVWYRTRIRGGQRKSLNFIYRPKLSKNIQMKFLLAFNVNHCYLHVHKMHINIICHCISPNNMKWSDIQLCI